MLVPLEKPGTPEELVHFGVKGMKWGHRRAVRLQANASFHKKNTTRRERNAAIRRARAQDFARREKYKTEHDPVRKAEMKKAYLNHPDHATKRRLTRGEKVALGLFAATGIGTLTIGAAVGANLAARHRTERKQAEKK